MTTQTLFLAQDLQCMPGNTGLSKPYKHGRREPWEILALAVFNQAVRDILFADDLEAAWAIEWLRKEGWTWFEILGIAINEPELIRWLEFETAIREVRLGLRELKTTTSRRMREEARDAQAN